MKTYIIKSGKHYSEGLNFGLTLKDQIRFVGIFDESCVYDHGNHENYDINKLYGFSTSIHHHIQSARVGWRCLDGINIQLLTYSYDGWKNRLKEKILGTVLPNQEFTCTITIGAEKFKYDFKTLGKSNSAEDPIRRKCWPFRYLLYPYFGGNIPAPHDMKINIQRIKP